MFNDVLVALLPFFPNMSFKFWERYHGGDGALVAGKGCDYSEVAGEGCDCSKVAGKGCDCSKVAGRVATVPRSPEGLRLL